MLASLNVSRVALMSASCTIGIGTFCAAAGPTVSTTPIATLAIKPARRVTRIAFRCSLTRTRAAAQDRRCGLSRAGARRRPAAGPSLDDDPRRNAAAAGALELVAHARGDVAIGHGMRPVGLGGDHRQASVRLLADGHVQRDLAEERHAEPLGLAARPTMAENIGARAAVRAEEIAHVLHDPEHRHV